MAGETTTVAVVVRDKVATTERALDHVTATVGDEHRIVAHLCTVPASLRVRLERRFGARVAFTFVDEPLLPAAVRNRVLADVGTDSVVFVDTDVVVRAGWLEALLACRAETGAHMVTPLILERDTQIHCAGNDLYVDHVAGVPRSYKVLRLYQFPYHDGSNLSRAEVMFGELHCQLVDTAMARDQHVFDEACGGLEEVDTGLNLHGAGAIQWFEPAAVVLFDRFAEVEAIDVDIYRNKWDPQKILDAQRAFRTKWGFDVTDGGRFHGLIADTQVRLGRVAARWPTATGVAVSRLLRRATSGVTYGPQRLRSSVHHRRAAGAAWDAFEREVESSDPPRLHPVAAAFLERRPV